MVLQLFYYYHLTNVIGFPVKMGQKLIHVATQCLYTDPVISFDEKTDVDCNACSVLDGYHKADHFLSFFGIHWRAIFSVYLNLGLLGIGYSLSPTIR